MLRFGKKERVYRLEFISNSPFSQAEFEEWYAVNKMEVGSLVQSVWAVHKMTRLLTIREADEEIDDFFFFMSAFLTTPSPHRV